MKIAMECLNNCYMCLSSSIPVNDFANTMADNSKKFATLWVALEGVLAGQFQVRPKLHLFQELCEMQLGTHPAMHWTYGDDDFGGAVVALGKRLGGQRTAKSCGWQTLLNFTARYTMHYFY